MRLFKTLSFILIYSTCLCQQIDSYEVYAIEYARPNYRVSATSIAVGANPKDTVDMSFFIYLLLGNNDRKILVDAGYLRDSTIPPEYLQIYTRPDSALAKINIKSDEITDVIITHPHWDHINGFDLFKNAKLWMQKSDYLYFVGDAWQKGGNNIGFHKQDVIKIVEANLDGKLMLIDGDSIEIIPGIRVFIGSKHTYGSQHVLVTTKDKSGSLEHVIIASDNCWYYYNLEHLLPITLLLDANAYVRELKRMKTFVKDPNLIIPGHDRLILSKFPQVAPGIVRIK